MNSSIHNVYMIGTAVSVLIEITEITIAKSIDIIDIETTRTARCSFAHLQSSNIRYGCAGIVW